jgi:hypothetical protein
MMSAATGHLGTVKVLVLKGADLKKEFEGVTALDWTAFKGQDKLVDFLINAGARFDEGGTVAKNCNACGKEDPGNILKCIGCKAIFYCCEECQNSDWKNHKAQCRNIKDKYKDKIKEEINKTYSQFQMEEQAKNDEAGPSISSQTNYIIHRSLSNMESKIATLRSPSSSLIGFVSTRCRACLTC